MFILADGGSAFSCGKTDELRYEESEALSKYIEDLLILARGEDFKVLRKLADRL